MRLGLIAMSGVRAVNAELMALGLTLPGFVERSRVIANLPSLALLTLAGLTPPEIDLDYVEVSVLPPANELPGEFDVVAISSYTAQIKDAYALADRYRRVGTTVVLGGLHVSALPDEARAHADCLVLGEAENVWPAAMTDLVRGELRGTYDGRRASFDLANAPMPQFELLAPERYNRITVQTQRGCPFSCVFCASSIRLAPKFKFKPVARVMAEIDRISEIWPRPFIEFADDNTFANKAHGKRLLRQLARRRVRWFTETDVSIADDEELLDLVAESGCEQLLIGLEAPSRRGLDGLEATSNWKAKRVDTYLTAIDRIQKRGVTVNGCFILGLDELDATSFTAVAEFARSSGLYEVQVTLLTPFPGTPLFERLQTQDRLLATDAWEKHTLFDVTFQPQLMSVEELETGFRKLIGQLYSPETTRARRREFFTTRSRRD
ncbi:MAG: radical SAM protein [Roseiarcus sp.]